MSKTKPYLDTNPKLASYALSLRNSSYAMGKRELQRFQKLSWRKKTRAYKMNNMSVNH